MEATAPVTVEQAATMLGVSPSTVHRRIRSGALRAEQALRPQGTVWLVHLPPETVVAAGDLPPPTAPEATAPTASVSTTPQAEALTGLVQATVATVLGPLVVELGASREMIERQAGRIEALARENGTLTAELEATAAEAIALKVRETRLLAERDAAQTAHAALLAAQSAPASSGAPAPWWRSWWLWLALLAAIGWGVVLLAVFVPR